MFEYWSGLKPPGISSASRDGDRVVDSGRVVVDRGRRDHDLGAVRAQHRDLLLAHLVGHDEDAAVALARRRDREPDAGVARGRLDDRPAGLAACPSRSAASIIARPIRSFTEPPGLRYSSFARIVAPARGETRSSRTIGVSPTRSSTVGYSRLIGFEGYSTHTATLRYARAALGLRPPTVCGRFSTTSTGSACLCVRRKPAWIEGLRLSARSRPGKPPLKQQAPRTARAGRSGRGSPATRAVVRGAQPGSGDRRTSAARAPTSAMPARSLRPQVRALPTGRVGSCPRLRRCRPTSAPPGSGS